MPDKFSLPEFPLERREFLRLSGFTFAAAALAGCARAPVDKALPYLIKPEEITPGRAYHYASTCAACSAGCGLLVKNRDGRPIKLEGNPAHPLSKGGLCAVGQASILGLYDSHRLDQPLLSGRPSSWDDVDREIVPKLNSLRQNGGAVRFLSGTVSSPTTNWVIGRFLSGFRDERHVVYDPLSASAILEAHELTHGTRHLPRYRFDLADVIVSFDADFLGTWISPVEYTAAYQAGRTLDQLPPKCSYHAQFEARLSLTGSKADDRFLVSPAELDAALSDLAGEVARRLGVPFPLSRSSSTNAQYDAPIAELADRLVNARGRSLIVCGHNDIGAQALCNFLNHILGNYGFALDLERPSLQRRGSDRSVQELFQELRSGRISALFIADANPVFDLPDGGAWANLIQKVPLVVSFAARSDETSSLAHFICPDHHYLEAWNDFEPARGVIGLAQPTIAPLGRTRALTESLSLWQGTSLPAYDILRKYWQENIFTRQNRESSFQAFWDHTLQSGFVELGSGSIEATGQSSAQAAFNFAALKPLDRQQYRGTGQYALILYPKIGMLDGRHAHSPWLHELPDPITKVTWDNYAGLSPTAAQNLSVADGDIIRLSAQNADGTTQVLELPVLVQMGQHDNVVSVALGYGSIASARFARTGPQWLFARHTVGDDGLVGRNAAGWLDFSQGALRHSGRLVSIAPTGLRRDLAVTQSHHSLAVPDRLVPLGGKVRPIIHEASFDTFRRDPASAFPTQAEPREDLWPPDHPYTGHRWAMMIDLSACTGCSACVIACQAENNVPVVGRDEVLRRREMHWIRIDRYIDASAQGVKVAFMPMLCQHCDNAPCESVCPVLATVHSEEGLSQQVYNRCVGTRYCANNCPYKVRRFNWFNYARNDTRENLVLNPDVVVRSRGVMEKCSFCVQRIQEAKIETKRLGSKITDADLHTACQQSCPAGAIKFGDLNDPQSEVAKLAQSPRYYRVLAELNTKPAVGYLGLVRNRAEAEGADHHG